MFFGESVIHCFLELIRQNDVVAAQLQLLRLSLFLNLMLIDL